MSNEVKIITVLIEQAKRGRAGLIVISLGMAEALVRQLQMRDDATVVEQPDAPANKKKKAKKKS